MKRPDEAGGGGMTGATGDLTPDDADAPFIPAELREISDPDHQADVTTAQGRHSEPAEVPADEAGGAAPRDGGSGSSHGLSPDDPAYRMEARPRVEPEGAGRRPAREGDGDEFSDQEEHF